MSDSKVNKLWGLKSGICDSSGLILYSLFLLGNAYCHLNSDILKITVKPGVHLIVTIAAIVTIAEAIAGIEPDPIPAIFTIVVVVNSDVSI